MEWKSAEEKPNRVDVYPVIVLADEDRGGYAREWVSFDGNIFLTHRKVLLWLDVPLPPLPEPPEE